MANRTTPPQLNSPQPPAPPRSQPAFGATASNRASHTPCAYVLELFFGRHLQIRRQATTLAARREASDLLVALESAKELLHPIDAGRQLWYSMPAFVKALASPSVGTKAMAVRSRAMAAIRWPAVLRRLRGPRLAFGPWTAEGARIYRLAPSGPTIHTQYPDWCERWLRPPASITWDPFAPT